MVRSPARARRTASALNSGLNFLRFLRAMNNSWRIVAPSRGLSTEPGDPHGDPMQQVNLRCRPVATALVIDSTRSVWWSLSAPKGRMHQECHKGTSSGTTSLATYDDGDFFRAL